MKSHPNNEPLFHFYTSINKKAPIGLISIPHSGEWIPEELLPYLTDDMRACQEDVDYKVNELIDIEKLGGAGIHVLVANVHRVASDLNRSQDQAILHWKNNTKGVPLVKNLPNQEEIKLLELKYHAPYFDLLKDLFEELKRKAKGDKVSFIDLHSMPSKPTAHHLKQNPNQPMNRPDFCLSDLKGQSCTTKYMENLSKLFQEANLNAKINDPYFGGYVTKFAHSFSFVNAIQIETNRPIYMDEKSKSLIMEKVKPLKEKLTDLLIKHFEINHPL